MAHLSDEVDNSVKPGDDFYAYVNNKWRKAHPIPDNKAAVGAMNTLSDENLDRIRKLLETPLRPTDSAAIQAVKQLYASGMDTAGIERDGLLSIQPVLDEAASLPDKAAVIQFLIDQHAAGSAMIWNPHLDIDDKDSRRYVLRFSQSGLGLPDRDYYFEADEKFAAIRTGYVRYLTSLLKLLGIADAAMQAQAIFDLETRLAAASDTALERRDVEANYNPYTADEMADRFPGIDWQLYLKRIGFPADVTVVVSQPKFLKASLVLVHDEPIETIRLYCMLRTINPLMSFLPKKFDELHFNFYGKKLAGSLKQEIRTRRVIGLCMGLMPEPVGQLFVEAHFDSKAKAQITELVGYIQDALRERIARLEWMSEATKQLAFQKLDTFLPLLGYPDAWRNYQGLDLGGSYANNIIRAKSFEWTYDAKRANRPVDRHEWLMSPAMVNAYYWPNTNGITFPAGILQPPLFDARGDFAANFGGIGIVIGHEITHGFDDKGALYDAIGMLNTWWKPKDWKAFEQRTKRLADQYGKYTVVGRKLNGELTLGENIADLGGTLIALDAMHTYMEKYDDTAKPVDGFTPDQRFFLSLARIWRENMRPELTLNLLVTNPHAPSYLRVNGVVPNVDAFYAAFKTNASSALYIAPDDRVRIW